jgi:hypothetical protein
MRIALACAAAVVCSLLAACSSSAKAAADHPGTPPAHCLQAIVVNPSGAVVCRLACEDFVSVARAKNNEGVPAVAITLTPEAGRRLGAATGRAPDEDLVVTFTWDGRTLDFRPHVGGNISERVMITGRTPGDLRAIDAIAVAFGAK